MAAELPTTTQGWELHNVGKAPEKARLTWNTLQPLGVLGPTDVLVKFYAAALNYSDVALLEGLAPRIVNEGVVPGADGAGEVMAVGERVSRFRVGDRVLCFLYQRGYVGGRYPSPDAAHTAIGGAVDGTFREHGIFDQDGLVRMPLTLSYAEGAAIMGTYVTTWNCLTGGASPLRPGGCVLVQGSGAASVSAVQLALAAGASVIATTSSDEKAAMLKDLGASHVINYKQDQQWGVTAKKLSPGGLGCTHVIDIIGDADSYSQSLEAVAQGGEIDVVGCMDLSKAMNPGPSLLSALIRKCTIRGVEVGSRMQLEEVVHAYQHVSSQKHFGKVVVRVL
ncbi:hypothetical protein B0I35DRAFT_470132 [Stachybotrys elegans]|uniref:Enoyl reductase (ER) domain-containing protein n=1 Tax=Stachybotrys elegans TaxID=80388 RepID=A0A8K0SIM7_9HYPO|nr:hypothetical protein B0I35DRAFT_470132 [Stachybotrys elegans]